MCDTLYKKTQTGAVFLKNSDRAANEPALTLLVDRRHAEGKLKCTYIEIDDCNTYACLLSKPSWTWGAEMGVNEFGVAAGNEAVFTLCGNKATPSLIGMDYVRLMLERSKSAKEAVDVALNLLFRYGQGGNCSFDHKFYYDNSYLIADKNEAYILETAGKEYAVKKIDGSGNISNRLSLTTDYDFASQKCNFAKRYTEQLVTLFSRSKTRQNLAAAGLDQIKDDGRVVSYLNVLRKHNGNLSCGRLFTKGSVSSVCMHAGILGDQTTSSMAVFWGTFGMSVWMTGASTPCLSVFKPVFFGSTAPPVFTGENDSFDYWLRREWLHRAIYAGIVDVNDYLPKAKKLEQQFENGCLALQGGVTEDYTLACSRQEQQFIDSFSPQIEKAKIAKMPKNWQRTRFLGVNVFQTDFNRYGKK